MRKISEQSLQQQSESILYCGKKFKAFVNNHSHHTRVEPSAFLTAFTIHNAKTHRFDTLTCGTINSRQLQETKKYLMFTRKVHNACLLTRYAGSWNMYDIRPENFVRFPKAEKIKDLKTFVHAL
jgi:hypothetical protein